MIVDDRQLPGEAVIQFDGPVVLQQEVLGDENVVHRGQVQQKNPAARGEAKRRGRNREEADDPDNSKFSVSV